MPNVKNSKSFSLFLLTQLIYQFFNHEDLNYRLLPLIVLGAHVI